MAQQQSSAFTKLVDNTYQCNGCNFARKRKSDVARHCNTCRHNPSQNKQQGWCPAPGCTKSFSQKDHYRTHYRSKHAGPAGQVFWCVGCPERFADRTPASRHAGKCSVAHNTVPSDQLAGILAEDKLCRKAFIRGSENDFNVPDWLSSPSESSSSAASPERPRRARKNATRAQTNAQLPAPNDPVIDLTIDTTPQQPFMGSQMPEDPASNPHPSYIEVQRANTNQTASPEDALSFLLTDSCEPEQQTPNTEYSGSSEQPDAMLGDTQFAQDFSSVDPALFNSTFDDDASMLVSNNYGSWMSETWAYDMFAVAGEEENTRQY